jgi:tetratricopeptide (TPR) repeat protein
MIRLRLAVASALIVWLTGVGNGQNPKPITSDTVAVLESWMTAVKTHTPGRVDESVTTVAAFSYATREELNAAMPLFFRVLRQQRYNTEGNRAAGEVAAMAHAAGTSFLKQAAVLHADVAAYSERLSIRPTGQQANRPTGQQANRPTGQRAVRPGEPPRDVPPLLIDDRLLISTDGQVVGEVAASWNWPFARSLVDLLREDPFVADWYHASAAYMFAHELYGDATSHLEHGGRVLPDDARMAFDRGCYAEALGLPLLQSLLSDRDIVTQRSIGGAPAWTPPSSRASLGIPTAERTNGDAERFYRRALSLDPALAEARVRLARLLDLRKRHDEAARELTVALGGSASPAVMFYARLFAGRTAQALGRASEAASHHEAALALFPDAQSALLAVSQLALAESDVAASIAPVERLGPRSADSAADPWWHYHLCAGRDADALLAAVWATVPHQAQEFRRD